MKAFNYSNITFIKANKITLIDYKTKLFVKSQRITDLKSWFSGDGYYNLTPVFLLNPIAPQSRPDLNETIEPVQRQSGPLNALKQPASRTSLLHRIVPSSRNQAFSFNVT